MIYNAAPGLTFGARTQEFMGLNITGCCTFLLLFAMLYRTLLLGIELIIFFLGRTCYLYTDWMLRLSDITSNICTDAIFVTNCWLTNSILCTMCRYVYDVSSSQVSHTLLLKQSKWKLKIFFEQPPCCCITFYKHTTSTKAAYFSVTDCVTVHNFRTQAEWR
jgi:hypothetical protein